MTPERWRQVENIFQTAAEIDGAERDAFLTEACGDDAELRYEVESLLAYETAETLTDQPFRHAIKGAARSLPIDKIESEETGGSLIGRLIGVYRVISLIGRGGMGAVYLAERDDAQFNQQVAIKIIKRGMDTDFIRERFLRERQILAGLDHPHIARLLDGGATEEGLPYFVMEHVDGVAITDYGAANKLSIAERLKLFRQVCAAVQHAHQKLVAHRDLKPSNILVNRDGAPKLLDFGVAKLLAPDADQSRTRTEQRMLTPDYASPEQVRGETITTAADIYSLGVVLYEMLTGRRLRQFKTALPAEIERAICETEPVKPSDAISIETFSAGKLQKQLMGDLDNIVLMAMRKEPERRYQSVEQFSEDIRRHLEGLPVIARPDTFTYRTGKFVRRHRLGLTATALVLLSLLGGVIGTTRAARIAQIERARAEANLAEANAQRTEAEKQRAEADRQRMTAEQQRAEADRQRLSAEQQRANAEAQSAEAERQRRLAETQRARAERRFAQVRKLANTFLFDFHDQIQNLPGSTAAREMLVKTALEYLDSLAQEAEGDPALQAELATAYEKVGDVQGAPGRANLGQRKAALESYRKALAIEEMLAARDPHNEKLGRTLSAGYLKIGRLQMISSEFAGARESAQKSLSIAERLPLSGVVDPENYDLAARGHALLGDIALLRQDVGEVLQRCRQSLEILTRWAAAHPGDRTQRGLATGYHHMSRALVWVGDLTPALEMRRQNVALIEAISSRNPSDATLRRDLSVYYTHLASLLGNPSEPNLGRVAEAVAYFRKSQALKEELAAADAKNALVRSDLIWLYRQMGITLRESAPAESVALLKKSIELSPPSVGAPRRPAGMSADILIELAKSHWRNGDREDARKNLQQARQALLNASPAEMAQIGMDIHYLYLGVGELLMEMGDAPGALEYYQKALPLAEEAVAKQPALIHRRRDLAACYEGLGNHSVKLATAPGLTVENQGAAWRAARDWFQKSLALWRDWPQRGPSSSFNLNRAEQAARALAQCEAALARLSAEPGR
jgi:serine/threonine protein kinase